MSLVWSSQTESIPRDQVDVFDVFCNFIQHQNLNLCSVLFKGLPLQDFEHVSDAAGEFPVLYKIPCCFELHTFHFLNILLCVGFPDSGWMLIDWSDKYLVGAHAVVIIWKFA